MGLVAWIVTAVGTLALSCDSAPPPQPAAAPATTAAAPEVPPVATPTTTNTAAQTPDAGGTIAAAPAEEVEDPKKPGKPPASKLLVPEGATAVGKWLDTFSYDSDVPVAIYEQDGGFFFSMEPPAGRIMRVPLEKKSDTHFVRADESYGEQFEIVGGSLRTRDDDGPIGTAKPYTE